MRKILLAIGKVLIIFSLLYPIPVWFLANWANWAYYLGMPDTLASGYWWWNLAILGAGLLLCIASCWSIRTEEPEYKCYSAIDIFNISAVAGVIIAVPACIAGLLMAIYWIFTDGLVYILYIIGGGILLAGFILGILGFVFYEKDDNSRKE